MQQAATRIRYGQPSVGRRYLRPGSWTAGTPGAAARPRLIQLQTLVKIEGAGEALKNWKLWPLGWFGSAQVMYIPYFSTDNICSDSVQCKSRKLNLNPGTKEGFVKFVCLCARDLMWLHLRPALGLAKFRNRSSHQSQSRPRPDILR